MELLREWHLPLVIMVGFLVLLHMECHRVFMGNLIYLDLLEFSSYLTGLVMVRLELLVLQNFLCLLVILQRECSVTFVVKQLPTSVYLDQEMDYLILLVILLPILEEKKLEKVYYQPYLVLLTLLLGIQKRHKCSSTLLEHIQVLSSLMVHLLVMEYYSTSLVVKREEHIHTLDLVPYSHSINLKRR